MSTDDDRFYAIVRSSGFAKRGYRVQLICCDHVVSETVESDYKAAIEARNRHLQGALEGHVKKGHVTMQ